MQVNFSAQRLRNFAIAIVAIVLVVALTLGLRGQNVGDSLEAQAKLSQPIDIALSNGKPTLMEFYADWCGVCQGMSKDLAAVKSQFGEKVNFSMLNVDNTKWLPEITKYRVDGIPHFVFFDRQGKVIAQAIGDQPRKVLESQLTDILDGKMSPTASRSADLETATKGEVSQFKPNITSSDRENPRAHGSRG
jgi:thioredoxin-like negative regulator of GroEL